MFDAADPVPPDPEPLTAAYGAAIGAAQRAGREEVAGLLMGGLLLRHCGGAGATATATAMARVRDAMARDEMLADTLERLAAALEAAP